MIRNTIRTNIIMNRSIIETEPTTIRLIFRTDVAEIHFAGTETFNGDLVTLNRHIRAEVQKQHVLRRLFGPGHLSSRGWIPRWHLISVIPD